MPDPAPNDTDGSTAADERTVQSGADASDDGVPADRHEASTAGEADGRDVPSGEIGRRRVLRTMVNTGYGAGILAAVEGRRLLSGPDEEVPITYALARRDTRGRSNLEARTTSVPAKWRERLERSFELREEIANLEIDGIRELFVLPSSFDDPVSSLAVTVADEGVSDRLSERLEETAVSIDVSVLDDLPPFESPDSLPENPVQVDDADTRRVPGGVLCQVESRMMGSLAPRLYDVETGAEWFATANHLFGERGTLRFDHAGEALYVRGPDARSRVGTVVRGYPGQDVARLEPVDGVRPASRIYGRAEVVGQFTKYGLALLKAWDVPLEKVGAVSGHTTGPVRGVDGITCYFGDVCKQGQLKWGDESATTDGDSGSVNFAPDPVDPEGSVLVGGFNNARTWWPGSNFAWGTAAHHLAETHGLHF